MTILIFLRPRGEARRRASASRRDGGFNALIRRDAEALRLASPRGREIHTRKRRFRLYLPDQPRAPLAHTAKPYDQNVHFAASVRCVSFSFAPSSIFA